MSFNTIKVNNTDTGYTHSIFDISEYNSGAIFADLSAALEAVPQDKKKGGMSIKFVTPDTPARYSVVKTENLETEPTGTLLSEAPAIDSGTYDESQLSGIFTTLPSDTGAGNALTYYVAVTAEETTTYTSWVITKVLNSVNKYVQWRLMSQDWSTTESDWQGVDSFPIRDSRNTVESGGVFNVFEKLTGDSQTKSDVFLNAVRIPITVGKTCNVAIKDEIGTSARKEFYLAGADGIKHNNIEYYDAEGAVSPSFVYQYVNNGETKNCSITFSNSSVGELAVVVISSTFTSGQVSVTISYEGELDKKVNKTDIVQETGNNTDKIISQKIVTQELNKKVNKTDIVQVSGDNTDKIMSQKAVKVAVGDIIGYTESSSEVYISFIKLSAKTQTKNNVSVKDLTSTSANKSFYLAGYSSAMQTVEYYDASGNVSLSFVGQTINNGATKTYEITPQNTEVAYILLCVMSSSWSSGDLEFKNEIDGVLDSKQDKLTTGYGIVINNNVITVNTEILESIEGKDTYSNSFTNTTVFAINRQLPLNIKLKNVSYSQNKVYIQLKQGSTVKGYLSANGKITSSLAWITNFPANTTVEIKDIDLESFNLVNHAEIDSFIISGASPVPQSGELEITISQPGAISEVNERLDYLEEKAGFTTKDITNDYVSELTINNACPLQIYGGDIKTSNAWKTRIYRFDRETTVILSNTGNLTSSMYDVLPTVDGACVSLLTYAQRPTYKKTILAGCYIAAAYFNSNFEVHIQEVVIDEPEESIVYNDVEYNKDVVSAFIAMMKSKKVDPQNHYDNRLVLLFHGDSILGSQLSEITNAPDYDAGTFPPNMSRMIVARKFYDKYKFSGEDTVFRNLKHSDWVKTGTWNTNNGFDNTTMFNKPEVWSCEEGASAVIDTYGYKFVKVVWSEYIYQQEYSFVIEFSKDDFANIAKTETKTITSARRVMQMHRVFDMSYYFTDWQTEHYKVRITPLTNTTKAQIWGVEMWNNPRLDVIVEAFSGSTAVMHKYEQLDSYNSAYINPHLIICDALVTNDSDYINRGIFYREKHTISNWFTSYKAIFDKIDELGIPVLMFAPHSANTWLTPGAESIARKYNTGVIDIRKKKQVVTPESSITGQDGTHLSNYGVTYYFEELEKIFDD